MRLRTIIVPTSFGLRIPAVTRTVSQVAHQPCTPPGADADPRPLAVGFPGKTPSGIQPQLSICFGDLLSARAMRPA